MAKRFQKMTFQEQEAWLYKRFDKQLKALKKWEKQFTEWDVWPQVVIWTAMYVSGWDYDSPMPPHLVKIINNAVKHGMETFI